MNEVAGAEEIITDESVRASLRLGWAVAEVRGRTRLGDDPVLMRRDLPVRRDAALPLSPERSPDEQHIEAIKVMTALGTRCGVAQLALPPYHSGRVIAAEPGETPPQYIHRLSAALDRAREAGADTTAIWGRIAEVFHLWDMHIQDTLASGPFGSASAYQLGRGLAETFWALDPSAAAGEIDSWAFLVGGGRHEVLCLLVDRLSFSMKPYTADAIKGSLGVWATYVRRHGERPPAAARAALLKQVTIWRDLLATDTNPLNLLAPTQGVLTARRIVPVVRGFVWELSLFLVGVAVLLLTAVLLVRGERNGAITGVIGIFGVTGAAGVAAVKGVTHEVGSQIRRAINGDLVVVASTTLEIRKRFGHIRPELNGS